MLVPHPRFRKIDWCGAGPTFDPSAVGSMPPMDKVDMSAYLTLLSFPSAKQNDGEQEELVLSIEETNKMREKLGLKPLSLENKKEQQIQQNSEKLKKEKEDEQKAAELQAKIAEMRSKRIASEAVGDKTIAEELADEPESALDWITKLKKKREEGEKETASQPEPTVTKKKSKVKTKKKPNGGADYRASGLTVAHAIDEFEEGETVVLTLKDTSILDESSYALNEGDDVLENVNLVETEKRIRNKELKKQRPGYAGYDDEEFDEKGLPKEKSVLAKYDRDDENYQRGEIKLNEEGIFDDVKAKRLEEMRRKLEAERDGRKIVTLSGSSFAKPSDYMSQEEAAAAFKKPAMKKKKKIRKKKFDIHSLVPDESQEEDFGSRTRIDRGAEEAQKRQRERSEAMKSYEKALSKATEESKRILKSAGKKASDNLGTAMDVEPSRSKRAAEAEMERARSSPAPADSLVEKNPFEASEDDDDDDAELQAALARARRHAQKKKENEIARLADEVARERENGKDKEEEEEEGGVFITATSEFVRGIELHQEDDDVKRERERERIRREMEERERDGTRTEAHSTLRREHIDENKGGWITHDVEEELIGMDLEKKEEKRLNEEELHKKAEEVQFIKEEPAVQRGLAGALELLRKRGALEKNDVIRAGRAKDERMSLEHNANEITIDRYDEYGRLMTTKEAWRALCHEFHGMKPGKKKQEKMLKKWKEELQQRGLGGSAKTVQQTRPLHDTMQKTGQAYVIYKGGSVKENLKEARKRAQDEKKEQNGGSSSKKKKT